MRTEPADTRMRVMGMEDLLNDNAWAREKARGFTRIERGQILRAPKKAADSLRNRRL